MSEELVSVGLPSMVEVDSSTCSISAIIDSFYSLLSAHKRMVRCNENVTHKCTRIKNECKRWSLDGSRLQRRIEEMKSEVSRLKKSERQTKDKLKSYVAKLKLEKEENRKMLAWHNQKNVQYRHETKRMEVEMDKMKKRLDKLLNGPRNSKRGGQPMIEMSKNFTRHDGSRGKWRMPEQRQKDLEEFNRTIIKQLQDRIEVLMEENCTFRDSLFFIQTKFNKHLECNTENLDDENCDVPREFFEMPSHELCIKIRLKMELKIEVIANKLNTAKLNESFGPRSTSSNEDDRARLSYIVDDLANTCNELQNIPRTLAFELCAKVDRIDLDEEARLAAQKRMFEERKINFVHEKKMFTDAAIKLSRERLAMDTEKAILHKERFLALESPISSTDCHLDKLPSTPELFKFLNLSPKNIVRGRLFRNEQTLNSSHKKKRHSHSCLNLGPNIDEESDEDLSKSVCHLNDF